MSLSSWWKSLFKKREVRTEPSRVASPIADLTPDRARNYLDRQGYAQPRVPARPYRDYDDGFDRDYQARRADRAELAADFAAAEAALLRDELEAAEHARERAEDRAEDAREDYQDHLREDREADQANAVEEHSRLSHELDDRPILPNGAVDPTWTANPPQQDSTPEPPKTDEQFYGRDSDFYGTPSTPDPTPAPSYEPPASYSAPDPTPSSSYDSGGGSSYDSGSSGGGLDY